MCFVAFTNLYLYVYGERCPLLLPSKTSLLRISIIRILRDVYNTFYFLLTIFKIPRSLPTYLPGIYLFTFDDYLLVSYFTKSFIYELSMEKLNSYFTNGCIRLQHNIRDMHIY